MVDRIPMTKDGAAKLQEELDRLKFKERPKVIEAIAKARDLGDLKENAEYHAAREHQGFLEGRIRELESKISHAHIIDVAQLNQDGKVVFGVTVTLSNIDDGAEKTYQIVGDDEADLKEAKISFKSPIARAVIGKSEGDEVSVETPGGLVDYEIVSVQYI